MTPDLDVLAAIVVGLFAEYGYRPVTDAVLRECHRERLVVAKKPLPGASA